MLIDADTHISPYTTPAIAISADELLRRMDRAGVDKAVVWLTPPYLREVAESNFYVHEAAQAHPDRLIPFGWIDPNLGLDAMRDEIARCHQTYGMAGIKMNGAQNSFIIDDPRVALPLVDAIAETGLALAFHIGTDAYDATHPLRLGRIAARHPDARVLMVHMGGVGFHDLSNAAIEVMEAHPNITGIGSAIRPVNVLKAIKRLGAARVCFGSDTPFNLMHVELAAYRALLDGELSADDQALVMGGNIARVLNIG
jgi:hypothetical protein